MTTAIKRRRGTTVQHSTFTGLEGELTVDTTKDTVVVHDGATAGGFPLAKESQATTNVAITGGSITGITDIAIADGGTGASTAANARTNLGVTATGADTTYAFRANNLSDLASASTARTNLGLGTIATQAASSVAVTGGTIDGTVIGGTTRAAGSFTTVTTTNDASISGLTVGKGGGSVASNTAVGNTTLPSGTTGGNNVVMGYFTGAAMTSGANNSAFGQFALPANTTGSNNVAVGQASLAVNTTGGSNIAVGVGALVNNTTASNNTAVGYQAGYSNTTGAGNTFVGRLAGYTGDTNNNTFMGQSAGYYVTGANNCAFGSAALAAANSGASGANNNAFGYQAFTANTTGYNGVAIGFQAAKSNTTGYENIGIGVLALGSNTTGNNNVAMGSNALNSNTTANNNTAVGYQAGYSNTVSNSGTFIGLQAGYASTGTLNTYVGYAAGFFMTSGAKNTILGSYSGNQGGLDIRTASNYIVLSDGDGNPRIITTNAGDVLIRNTTRGGQATLCPDGIVGLQPAISCFQNATTSQEQISFRNPNGVVGSINTSGTSTSYVTSSDYRLKEDVKPMVGALDIVSVLKPVTYKWKVDGSSSQGFIAHELAEVCPESVVGEKDAVDAEGKPVYQGIDTSFLVATLTASIQELHEMVKAQALEIAQLKGN